ncbi:hypothetical protein MPSEU_000780300 [Mayamaea pseudoterrestris]|nr:hypothetical protein MPSEU_000780300 [Mayamaea pseudoterrestris]
MGLRSAILYGCLSASTAFVAPSWRNSQQLQALSPSCSSLQMSLRPLHDSLCNQVTQKLGLQVTDFTDSFGASSWSSSSGASGTAAWLSEANPQFLTGVSYLTRQDGQQEDLTLNVWMGPSYDVPHCLLTFGSGSNGYHVTADYVPRGPNVMGADPQYLQTYYNENVQAAWKQAHASGQALSPPIEFEHRLLHSPARFAVGGLDASTAERLACDHVNRFLAWIESAPQIPARSRGSFNMRDDKLRQFYFRAQLQEQVNALGDDLGRTVAAVNTGPTAEAYVGGGS